MRHNNAFSGDNDQTLKRKHLKTYLERRTEDKTNG